jgi:hypothetical protein
MYASSPDSFVDPTHQQQQTGIFSELVSTPNAAKPFFHTRSEGGLASIGGVYGAILSLD